MPRMSDSAVPVPANMMRLPPPSSPTPPLPTGLGRHPLTLASLPGVGSGPDAVLRQFGTGRAVPGGRLLVPR